MITATFKNRLAAEHALIELEKIGVTESQVGMLVSDETRGASFNIETGTKLDEGAAAGATAGGIIGALIGVLSTATAMAIPGVNVVVAGSLVSAMAGAGTGAIAGGLLGGLIGAGIPEHEAVIYENEVKNGSVLMAVKPRDGEQKKRIKAILEREDAYNLAA